MDSSQMGEVSHSRRGVISAAALGAIAALLPIAPIRTFAQPRVPCVRAGQRIVSGGFAYSCVRQKGRLVWRRGKRVKVVVSPSPTPSQLPSSSATPATSPTPTTSPPTASPVPSPSASPSPTPTPTPSVTTKRTGYFIARSSDVLTGESKIFSGINLSGRTVQHSLFRSTSGIVSALDLVCTHAGCLVKPEKSELVCKCHFSYFDAATGERKSGPANDPLRAYQVSEVDGEIYIVP